VDVDRETGLRGGRAAGGRALTARGLRTRRALVAAAKEVFETTPFAEARITDITAHARVATGTFYRYFDTKEEIFREVAAEVLTDMSAAPRQAPPDDADPIAAIAHASRQYFLGILRHAGIARSIEQLALRDGSVAGARRRTVVDGVRRAERWIRDLQHRGICDTGIDPWTTAMVLHTMNVRVAYDHLLPSKDERDIDALVEAVTHVWARTVGLEQVNPGPPTPGHQATPADSALHAPAPAPPSSPTPAVDDDGSMPTRSADHLS
jgi:AcrR family transcriptional regulator